MSFRPLAGIMVLIALPFEEETSGAVSFRPLAGIMVLIQNTSPLIYCTQQSFSPLAGIMVLIGRINVKIALGHERVSVPLRGLWFLSEYTEKSLLIYGCMFPSPCGDYGSYLLACLIGRQVASLCPSPCGDYGSYHPSTRMYSRLPAVSVPLRGLWFLSLKKFKKVLDKR